MEVKDAKVAVEAMLLALAVEFGRVKAAEEATVEVVLWESDHPAVGIRVAEVSFTKSSNGEMLGKSWLHVDLGGLRACAAMERCILARIGLTDEGDVVEADFNLRELFQERFGAATPADEGSQEKYVRLGGTQCPFCNHTDINGSEVNIDQGTATQEVTCSECGKHWVDRYKLTGFIQVE